MNLPPQQEGHMSLEEFINTSDRAHEADIDPAIVKNVWYSVDDGAVIYVSDELIRWMGYTSHLIGGRKRDFLYIARRLSEPILTMGRTSYAAYYTKHGTPAHLPPPSTVTTAGRFKHVLITRRCLRMMAMKSDLPSANRVRIQFADMDALIDLYKKRAPVDKNTGEK